MKLIWKIDKQDIEKVKSFYNSNKNNRFVNNRIRKNILKKDLILTHTSFWKTLEMALLTTRQRSGPNTPIDKFSSSKPFPLSLKHCKRQKNLKKFVKDTLSEFGGIRIYANIAKELEYNFGWLEQNNWKLVDEIFEKLINNDDYIIEREYAEDISKCLKGFGPKQSRNLLQDLGLTKYEIPLDSRITKWLNNFGFPIKLSANALGDRNYYNFVLDGFQALCKSAKVYPCVMDAVIFSSFDKGW